jgi:hypothetical protein
MTPGKRVVETLRASESMQREGMFDDAILAAWIDEAVEEVRESCAKMLDREAMGFQVLIDHAPTPIRAEDLKRVKWSLENVAGLIRARSTSP